MKRVDDFRLRLGKQELVAIVVGGMGVDISTAALALEAARADIARTAQPIALKAKQKFSFLMKSFIRLSRTCEGTPQELSARSTRKYSAAQRHLQQDNTYTYYLASESLGCDF
jgi:hypothetical protein